MSMPKKISTWFLIVYFLLVALASFGVWAAPAVVMGIVALGVAVLLLMDR
jgi:hypothetical protein